MWFYAKKSEEWREVHPDYAKEKSKTFREENPEYYSKYRRKNKRKLRKY